MKIENLKIESISIDDFGYIKFVISNNWYRVPIGEPFIPFLCEIKLPQDSYKANELLDKFRNKEKIEVEI